jgi:phosphoglycerate kinase
VKIQTVRDVDLAGKTVLLRVDYNVPFRPGTTDISDDGRIRASLPTVQYLIDRECRLLLCSHLGRPKGRVVDDLRIAPVSRRLSELLDMPVAQAPECVGAEVRELVAGLPPGGVVMLENLRFHPGEEGNDPEFAAALASPAEIYVDDAFGAAHRAHASTDGVTRYLPAVAGLLMARELEVLGNVLDSPRRPFAAIMGGAKVSDKIGALKNLAAKVDTLIVGGGMAATFLKAKGLEVGDSLIEDEQMPAAVELIHRADDLALTLLLPKDVVVSDSFSATARRRVVDAGQIPRSWRVMDIGPRTASLFENALSSAKTVVWNGPMGVFEWEPFADGTIRIARTLAGLKDATTVIGGGSTAEVVAALGLDRQMTHVSTGGGATLELLAGNSLPGVAALMGKSVAV